MFYIRCLYTICILSLYILIFIISLRNIKTSSQILPYHVIRVCVSFVRHWNSNESESSGWCHLAPISENETGKLWPFPPKNYRRSQTSFSCQDIKRWNLWKVFKNYLKYLKLRKILFPLTLSSKTYAKYIYIQFFTKNKKDYRKYKRIKQWQLK